MLVSFPWRTVAAVDRERTYVALLGEVRLSGAHILLPFIRFGIRIERQLRSSPGVLGFRTGTDFPHLRFYHLSVWDDRSAIQRFTGTAPHLDAVTDLSGRLGETNFRYWTVPGGEVPLRLSAELHRLDR